MIPEETSDTRDSHTRKPGFQVARGAQLGISGRNTEQCHATHRDMHEMLRPVTGAADFQAESLGRASPGGSTQLSDHGALMCMASTVDIHAYKQQETSGTQLPRCVQSCGSPSRGFAGLIRCGFTEIQICLGEALNHLM